MIKKMVLLLSLFFGVMIWLIVDSQSSTSQVYKVGVLSHASIADPSFEGFKKGLAAYGYVEGQNIVYLYEGATGDINLLEKASRKLLDADVDMILTLTTPAALQAKKDTKTLKIPVIFAPASNPVQTGLVESIQFPGGNLTGVTFGLQEQKRLEWFLTLVPNVRSVYYPYNPSDKSPVAALEILSPYMKMRGTPFVEGKVTSVQEMDVFLQEKIGEIDAIYLTLDALVSSQTELYIQQALKHKLPLCVPTQSQVKRGGLMSYGFSLESLGEQASRLAKQIFEGAKVENIPVEHAEFKLSINKTTAEKIGLVIDQSILNQAVLFQ